MTTPYEDRDRQFREVSQRLGDYQQRYPELHLAHEYRDWVLETRAKGTTLLDYEQDFLRRLERRKHRLSQIAGEIDYDAAVPYEHLRDGFRRLVQALDHFKQVTGERLTIYAEEFQGYSREEFEAAVTECQRTMTRFPYVSDLLGVLTRARRQRHEAETARQLRDIGDEFQEERRKRRETSAAIDALSDEDRAALMAEAEAEVAKLPDWFGEGLREIYRGVAQRVVYERRYSSVPASVPGEDGSDPASLPGEMEAS